MRIEISGWNWRLGKRPDSKLLTPDFRLKTPSRPRLSPADNANRV